MTTTSTLIDAQARVAPGEALRSYQKACDALADAGLLPSDALRAAETGRPLLLSSVR